jgi:hypothetical protein
VAVEQKCQEDGVTPPATLNWNQLLSKCLQRIEMQEATFSRKMLCEPSSSSQLGETDKRAREEKGAESCPPQKRNKKND